ncbi:hypothetical protein EOE67_01770 [Rheinheimera riviphila]|uniref:Bacterial Pleckstrin homology domain-containing protein n=1 Tax=Rheinheimera riviphila TaxID=1834037 RepID=A0A437R5D0_9GAMM|nr:hypothetical protein [Rheinheimera riviphila]RVU41943.1 hypothetical protein EOE67_01770 [Rheinheimera riviphila]
MLSYYLELPAATFLLLFAVCILLPAVPITLIHRHIQPIPRAVWLLTVVVATMVGLSLCTEIWFSKITISGRQIQIDGLRYQTQGEIARHGVTAVPGTLQQYQLYRRNGLDLYWTRKGHFKLSDGPVYLAAGPGPLYQLTLTDGRRLWLSVAPNQEPALLALLDEQQLLKH